MIVLIDGFSIAFRAFYALPETLMTSKGTPTNVIHGFLSMLNKISTDYKLEQLIVTWDLPGKTFRNDYTFKNSEWAIKRFPFPFHEDSYMYSVTVSYTHLTLPTN